MTPYEGLGEGLVGALVKPVVGASDAVASVMVGISQAAQSAAGKDDDRARRAHARPRRALPQVVR